MLGVLRTQFGVSANQFGVSANLVWSFCEPLGVFANLISELYTAIVDKLVDNTYKPMKYKR